MASNDRVFAGSIPRIYDEYLVPLIFERFAADLAARVASGAPATVLEIAAGTGVVARALAPKLPSSSCYVVTDLNPPMLELAKERQSTSEHQDERITWRQADAMSLPFADGEFDTACCQFGAMFFPDRVQSYREAKRVLKPSGRFVFNVWDRIEDNVFAWEIIDALAELYPLDPPRFLARTPHGYCDQTVIRRELEQAGFSKILMTTRSETSRAPSPRDPAIAYCQGTPLRAEIEARGDLATATDHAAVVIARKHGSGAVEAKIQGIVIEATA